ncbi:FadR/GntR family transcriptional regulator [Desulfopila aestuarii]|uniref:Transcriptional regulator, GntR family n=1 Tax=Desulfopila aestuarii DSM 18488 TaxID=1121416 RepID=A0A1M7Y9P9_9BACT|nr:FadR/GntR family transcriptional regulator [Desulfopila aestuarii]SHO49319.1 transcriptional regulator, GntR family [Desulfopila aestuarii DSM 18488]
MSIHRHDEIVQMIEDLIRSGELRPSDRLPAERHLAESCKVSRNTIREAIKVMTEKGVVVSRRGAGTYVSEGALACIIDGAARRRKRLQEVFELRKILEPQIAALAAQRITAADLAELEKVLSRQRKAVEHGRDQVELDEHFHRLIAQAADNSLLGEVYETLHEVLAESRVRELQSPERNRLSLNHHEKIAGALQDHSPERAAEMMRQHMEQVEKNLQHQNTIESLDTFPTF